MKTNVLFLFSLGGAFAIAYVIHHAFHLLLAAVPQ
jgi:hypothetical protein